MPGTDSLKVVAIQGARAVVVDDVLLSISRSATGWSYKHGKTAIWKPIDDPQGMEDLLFLSAFKTTLCVPIRIGTQTLGVLNFGSFEDENWAAERPLLEHVGLIVASHLLLLRDRRRARESLAQSEALIRSLCTITEQGARLAAESTELDVLLASQCLFVECETGARVGLAMVSSSAERCYLSQIRGDGVTPGPLDGQFPLGRRGRAVLESGAVEQVESDWLDDPADAEILELLGVKRGVAVSLRAAGDALGVLFIGQEGDECYSGQQLTLVQHLAATLAGALAGARAQDAVREAHLVATEQAREQAAFLAVLTHEVRTPLHAVVGMSEVLDATELPEAAQGAVRTIRLAGQGLKSVLDDVITFSRPDEEVHIVDGVHDVALLFDDLTAMVASQVAAKGLALRMEVPPEVTEFFGDRHHVQQVLLNLLTNAIKFTPEGEVVLRAEVCEGGRGLELSVLDTGVGIADEALELIFNPFQQSRTFSESRSHPGVGLGLAICQRLARSMGGSVRVTSELGVGSVFTLVLPEALVERGVGQGSESLVGGVDLSRHRVLVVDDHQVNWLVAKAMLQRLGVQADVVDSAASAREVLHDQRYDLALIDLHMPVEGGPSLARWMARSLDGGPSLVALTADARAEVRSVCEAAGFSRVLLKPVSLADLEAVLLECGRAPR